MRKYDLYRIISFHSGVARAREFAVEMPEVIAWIPARQRPKGELFAALEPYTAPTGYVNYLADDDSDRIASAYRPNFDRLVEVKQRYDPANLFRLNHPSQSEHQPFSMS